MEVHWGGGEPTLLKEFPQIMDLFLDKLEPMLRIYSSGIKYSSHIEKAIKLGCCTLIISLDSGNPDLYKKIKNVDEFNTVVNNIAIYCKAQDELPERKYVILKYILIPGVNDTEEYIASDEVVAFWGAGYTPSMYQELEQRRSYWIP